MSTHYLDNYYARLGIGLSATPEDIQRAYRLAARKFHPDTNQDAGARELFLLVQEAYNVLSDPNLRTQYNTSLPPNIDAPALMVNALYSRGQVTPGEPEQVVYVLLDLMAADIESDQKIPPLNVCLVLDTSTSMAGSRLSQVVKAATVFFDRLGPQDLLSIVTFNDRAELLIPAQRGQDAARFRSRLSTLQPRGGTEILHGLETGLAEVLRNRQSNSVSHIVLITDGRTYGDEEASLGLAAQAANQGIPISVVGIGEGWNEAFVDKLAAKAGGSSLYADKTTEIYKLLEQKFSGLNQCYANNVKLAFQHGQYSELAYAFRLAPELGMLSVESPVFLGSVPIEGSLSVLLEFDVDAKRQRDGDLTLAEGDLRLDIPSRSIPSTSARFELSRPVKTPIHGEAPPQALINAIGKLSLFRMQERAREDIEAGDTSSAAKRLRMLATHLLSSGEKGLARTVLLAAEDLKHSGILDEKTGKQIKYGTRALIEPVGTESNIGKTSIRRRTKK